MTDLERFERTFEDRVLAHAVTIDAPFDAWHITRETAAVARSARSVRGWRDARRAASRGRVTAAVAGVLLVGSAVVVAGAGQQSPPPPTVTPPTASFLELGWTDFYFDRAAVAALPDGRALIVGDSSARGKAAIFDPATNRFHDAGQLPVIVQMPTATATALRDGRVVVTEPGSSIPAQVWDPASSSFHLAGTPVTALPALAPSVLSDGRLLFARGTDQFGRETDAQVFDPATESFTAAGAVGDSPILPAGTWLPDGRLFVAGAETSWLIDPTTGDRRPTGGLDDGADWHAWSADHHWVEPCAVVALADGSVLALGGRRSGSESPPETDDAALWEPTTGVFQPLGRLPTRLAWCAAAALPDGQALVVGEEGALLVTRS
ncbi:MAG: hypothetical protein U0869_15435 [Chloroflexota bacterium]